MACLPQASYLNLDSLSNRGLQGDGPHRRFYEKKGTDARATNQIAYDICAVILKAAISPYAACPSIRISASAPGSGEDTLRAFGPRAGKRKRLELATESTVAIRQPVLATELPQTTRFAP